jgi:hypothetical protein
VGARNVKTAYANWGHLPHGPFRLLSYMSLIALDADTEPKFWGGREALAIALGRLHTFAGSGLTEEEREHARETGFLAVKRALRTLKAAGAITPLNVPGPGHQAIYRLNLTAPVVVAGPTSMGEDQ